MFLDNVLVSNLLTRTFQLLTLSKQLKSEHMCPFTWTLANYLMHPFSRIVGNAIAPRPYLTTPLHS